MIFCQDLCFWSLPRGPLIPYQLCYSCRKAVSGSILDARVAGAKPAKINAAIRIAAADNIAMGSAGFIPNTKDLMAAMALQ